VPAYAPGSFTKNFGWNLNPPGLNALYVTIRAGFAGAARPVPRDYFRSHCGIRDHNRQLIPVNFFLHNTVARGTNYVSADELVRHAINNPHSRVFDQMALFAMHLARMGRRVGVAGDSHGAAFTNNFVRNRLWEDGGWRSERLSEGTVESAFEETILAQGGDTVHKCMTNYVFMMEMMGLKGQAPPFINTHIENWVGPGLFIAFDRYALDREGGGVPPRTDLVSMVRDDELHKLMGTTEGYLESIAPIMADEYVSLGGLQRVTSPAVLDAAGAAVVSSPTASANVDESGGSTVPAWSDQDAQNAVMVMRRLQESQAQIRNAQNVRELKALYAHSCMFCGKQTVIGVEPSRYYSEASHVKPLGQPHNGPDHKSNMLILCPEHHIQFDYGVLRIRRRIREWRIWSQIPGDPLHDQPVRLQAPHSLDGEYIWWHYLYWSSEN
jgi:hypothetical protein